MGGNQRGNRAHRGPGCILYVGQVPGCPGDVTCPGHLPRAPLPPNAGLVTSLADRPLVAIVAALLLVQHLFLSRGSLVSGLGAFRPLALIPYLVSERRKSMLNGWRWQRDQGCLAGSGGLVPHLGSLWCPVLCPATRLRPIGTQCLT